MAPTGAAPATRLAPPAWVALALVAAAVVLVHAIITIIAPDASRFTFDSAEYALAGRAWLETGRLETPFVYPTLLGTVSGPPFPLVAGHPLVPALDALAFALAGRTPDASLIPSMLAYVACVLLVARLALSLAGSRLAALGAALAFAVSPWALRFACEGRSEMPFAALLTAALLLLAELPRAPRPFTLGLVLGFAHLARPVLVPILPAFALGFWLLAPAAQRARLAWRVLAGFLPLAAITAIYKAAATGNPFADVGGYLLLTGLTPEWAVSRLNRMTPPPDALSWVRAHPEAWADKISRNVRSTSYGAWLSAGRWSGTLAQLGAALVWLPGRGGGTEHAARARRIAVVLAAATALLTLLAAATVADPRMLFPVFPAGFALALAGFARLAETRRRWSRPALALTALLAVLAGAIPLTRHWCALRFGDPGAQGPGFHAREWRDLGGAVSALLPRDGLVASDAAPWIAWYTRRATTGVPLAPSELDTWPERFRPAAVVLTNEWLVYQPLEGAWREVLERDRPPAGYGFAGHVHAGRLEAAVFTRVPAP